MENKCKYYDFDCKCEEMGCKGCAYYKNPVAKKDETYIDKCDEYQEN